MQLLWTHYTHVINYYLKGVCSWHLSRWYILFIVLFYQLYILLLFILLLFFFPLFGRSDTCQIGHHYFEHGKWTNIRRVMNNLLLNLCHFGHLSTLHPHQKWQYTLLCTWSTTKTLWRTCNTKRRFPDSKVDKYISFNDNWWGIDAPKLIYSRFVYYVWHCNQIPCNPTHTIIILIYFPQKSTVNIPNFLE